jgi:molybdopterin/thiamine biosynthesis adenylyltransferase
MRIVHTQDGWSETRAKLLERLDVETCAIGMAHSCSGRMVVHDIRHPNDQDYLERSGSSAQLTPDFIFDTVKRARATGSLLVFMHTHPADPSVPSFSAFDDAGEQRLKEFLHGRLPGSEHAAIVVSPGGVRARILGMTETASVLSVGRKLRVESGLTSMSADEYDRQVRAFGAEGQSAIAALKVGIVGLGGTGSLTAQQLAHLGVRDFVLIDFDKVDKTSLNRLVGAALEDVGTAKIDVAQRLIKATNPDAMVEAFPGDVADNETALRLLDRDVVFGCTDSHASRAVLGQIAYQYLIPVIDMGVSLSVRDGKLAKVTGRAQLLTPGLPCFTCLELLDSEQIRREMMTSEQRAADPYIDGAHEPQPSVISLNGTISSLAVTMFIGLVTEAPIEASYLRYEGIKGLVRPTTGTTDASCYVCSASNSLARASTWPLPTRFPGR